MRNAIGIGLLAGLLLAVPVVYARAQQKQNKPDRAVLTSGGFSTGKAFLGWSEESQGDYGVGFFNGLSVAHIVTGTAYDKMKWLDSCTNGFRGEQIGAIIRKYIQNHPSDWQDPLNSLSLRAMEETCKPDRR
jgi:hypothetical protein